MGAPLPGPPTVLSVRPPEVKWGGTAQGLSQKGTNAMCEGSTL